MQAYITSIWDKDDVWGVLILNAQLRKFNSKHELLCIVPLDFPEPLVAELSKTIRVVRRRDIAVPKPVLRVQQEDPNLLSSYNSLHVFNVLSYEKLIFIDLKCFVRDNIDVLFGCPSFSAAPQSFEVFDRPSFSFFVFDSCHKNLRRVAGLAQAMGEQDGRTTVNDILFTHTHEGGASFNFLPHIYNARFEDLKALEETGKPLSLVSVVRWAEKPWRFLPEGKTANEQQVITEYKQALNFQYIQHPKLII